MVLKRQLSVGGEGSSGLPNKHRHILSNLFKGVNNTRALQESVSSLEPIIRKWVQEAVESSIDRALRNSRNQSDCFGPRTLQLRFHKNLPHTLFTGSSVVSEDKSSIKIVLYDTISRKAVTSGPLSSTKVNIVVLDADFTPDDLEQDWSKKEFEGNIVQNREGKRPLVTGELMVTLQDGVGYIGKVSFTDNSSWIRSGKFRLGAKMHTTSHDISVREGMSNAFKVKDHRGESYQKHFPPCLDDEVWRLEKIAKDGASHKKLTQRGIFSVGDFLKLYFTNRLSLRSMLPKMSNVTWNTIIEHAMTCTLDDKKYMFKGVHGTCLFFDSVCKVIGVTFDGQSSLSLDNLNIYQARAVEDLKQYAYKHLSEWVPVSEPSIVGYPMLLPSPAVNSFNNPNNNFPEQDQLDIQMNTDHSSISPPYNCEVEQDHSSSFEIGESSHQMQGFNPTFTDSFGISDSPGGFYNIGEHTWPLAGNYMGSHLSIDDIPVDLIPWNERPKMSWCKVLAVVKWRILAKRNVAARKRFYSYI
ncbi:hypothetical protein RD792_002098 [Penstemon davidsonii]|uniref:Calmodulin-binding protein n=1 Tax=Penstemon davidsonii TaxID=160366 RepID=A0ABR0DQU8_9LAMI|nr:hypothetical protein RD792_002098 [Penstemon davidsonii]